MTKPTKKVIEYAEENDWGYRPSHVAGKVFVSGWAHPDKQNLMSQQKMEELYQNRQAYAQEYADMIIGDVLPDTKGVDEVAEFAQERLIQEQRKLNNQKKGKL